MTFKLVVLAPPPRPRLAVGAGMRFLDPGFDCGVVFRWRDGVASPIEQTVPPRAGVSAWAGQAMAIGCDEPIRRAGQPAQGRVHDQQSDHPPGYACCDERPADGVGAPPAPPVRRVRFEPPDRSLSVCAGQSQLLQFQRLPRLRACVRGQAGLDPAGRPDAEAALSVIDQKHLHIVHPGGARNGRNWQRFARYACVLLPVR